jgi:hypothetical protein
MEGVTAGENMLSFIDLDKSAIQRCSDLLPWIRSWCGVGDIHSLLRAGLLRAMELWVVIATITMCGSPTTNQLDVLISGLHHLLLLKPC